ncbi:MAG: tRNA(Met) cytidine acetyltransferase, partial [Thermoproteus sp.]|nr:tRNA(Met) cytidine acetyltransferase [Thermoproteus sp.]
MLKEVLVEELNKARRAYHRRLVALVGTEDRKIAEAVATALEAYAEVAGSGVGIYMFQPEYADGNRRHSYVRDLVAERKIGLEVEFRPYKDTPRLLGRTYDFAVLDLINDLKPNDVGRLGGVVRGGGLYVVALPPLDVWSSYITKFQATLLIPQYKPADIRHRLKERFWKKLFEHNGIIIYDVEKGEVLKRPEGEPPIWEKPEVKAPEKAVIPIQIYKLAATQDQVAVLQLIERLYERPKKKQALVVIADRGRGKSAALGLGLAGVGHRLRKAKSQAQLVVSAMEYSNVETLFEFLLKGLKALGYKPAVEKEGGEIKSVKARGIFVDFITPYQLLKRERADIVAVDEAASIPLPVLYATHAKFDRTIYSTTVHGYEGSGRGFSIRFLKYLKEDENTEALLYEMREPIRYGRDDPVERWLFDVFLLDAEPEKLEEDYELIKQRRVKYLDEASILSSEEGLRHFFGIYVQAHYRNEPDDLGMLLDAPHHRARALALENGKIAVSLELAEEGGLGDDSIDEALRGLKLPGNIIPDRFLKYWRLPDFAKLKGLRIVRIATHPEAQGMGLGSLALKAVEEEARAEGYDWVGVGFGVYGKLLNFWIKNGYIPIHISPERNPVSGEYSVLLIKPLNERATEFVKYANVEFRRRLIHSLMGPYSDLDPREARLLLEDWGWDVDSQIELSKNQIDRLVAYCLGPMTFENVSDALYFMAVKYFYSSKRRRPTLGEAFELALIGKVLQARPWKEAAEAVGVKRGSLMLMLREVAKTFLFYYYGGPEGPPPAKVARRSVA